nr:immunoglobulin light chain junction region [Mus musculus]NSL97683.1 immunoglobulin light chain junction region [Mus musculus]NSL97982.1 immunoglobulin light chain junction region [Mus musculus]NSL98799.1 immunoglobulin light chain junction region [Mus musculus]NSL99095.1 immunoglobulin light chain junction region [Mus musculus]
CQQSNSWPYTF